MKSTRIPARLAAIAAVAITVVAGACGGDTAGERPAEEGAAEEVVYVDVRTPEEFAAGHVAGAINIPHTQMPERWRELERFRDDRLVVYCRSGRRSGIALDVLREAGFEHAENGGGLTDLARRGVPTTR